MSMILIISNSRDFATDYVIAQLLERRAPYVRIDLDLLADESVCLDPVSPRLTITDTGRKKRASCERLERASALRLSLSSWRSLSQAVSFVVWFTSPLPRISQTVSFLV